MHSEKEALAAEKASQALFGQGELAELEPETLRAALKRTAKFSCETGISVVSALVESGLVESNGQARTVQSLKVRLPSIKSRLPTSLPL